LLTHDAFELELARMFEHHGTVYLHVFRVDDRWAYPIEQPLKHTLSLQQWRSSKVKPIEVHHVEEVEQHGVRLPAIPQRRLGEMIDPKDGPRWPAKPPRNR
jgi:hypothetical protein